MGSGKPDQVQLGSLEAARAEQHWLGGQAQPAGGLVFSQLAQCCSCDGSSLSSRLLICKRVSIVNGP